MFKVYINRIGKFLPNEPVSNDEMETYLGKINNKESKAKRIVLRNNGITTRYYALNKEGKPTHNNVLMTANAIRDLMDEIFTVDKIELIACGTSSPDFLMPSLAVMVHGELKCDQTEVYTASGNCCAGMSSLKFGYLSVKSGETENAVCTGSERMSSWMVSDHFDREAEKLKELDKNPIISFEKEFLRWMLSDGAGAFLLENSPKGEYPLQIKWIDGFSFADQFPPCMYAGSDFEEGELKSFSDYSSDEWLSKSIFSVKQDTKLLDKAIISKGVESIKLSFNKHNITPDKIDYFLPHLSSLYFADKLFSGLIKEGIGIPKEKWFINLTHIGNIGAGSIYLMLEELVASGKLKKGDNILLSVPESARFTFSNAYLTVC